MRVTSLRGTTSGGSFCGPAGGAGAEERLRGRIRNRVCTWSRHLRRRAGCVGFWVMITHRNAGHVRRRLAECCDFLPGWWTAPKPAGPQTRLKRTQNAALPPTRECKSAHFPFARAASPTKGGGEGGGSSRGPGSQQHHPPPPDFNYLPGGMWRIPRRRRRLHFTGPVPSAVPVLFSLYRVSRTCGIYLDFPPPPSPPPLRLLSEVFSLRLFFPATVLTPSLAADTSGLPNTPPPHPDLTPLLVQVLRKPPHLSLVQQTQQATRGCTTPQR